MFFIVSYFLFHNFEVKKFDAYKGHKTSKLFIVD